MQEEGTLFHLCDKSERDVVTNTVHVPSGISSGFSRLEFRLTFISILLFSLCALVVRDNLN